MRLLLLLLMLILSFLNAQNIVVDLKWKHSFQFAGFYIAKEKGFYKKYGLNVMFRELNKNNPIEDVLNKKAQFGISNSNIFYYRLLNKPLIALMPIFETSPLALVSTDLNIKSPKDIQGHIIHTPKAAFQNIAMLSMLKKAEIELKNIKITNNIYSYNDLLHKKGLYLIYITDQLYYLQKNNIPYNLFFPKEEGIDTYGDILFTSEEFLKTHPETVKNFVKATKKGWNWAKSHIDETIDIILKKYNTQQLTKDKLQFEAYKTITLLSSSYLFNREKVNQIKLLYQLIFNIKNNFKFLDAIYSPYIQTQEEKDFIENHLINCSTTISWPPFNFLKNNHLDGIAIDFWNIIKEKLYLKSFCDTVPSFSTVLQKIKAKKTDLTVSTTETPVRKEFALFSEPYVSYPIVIATKSNINVILSMEDLYNKKIAIGKNYTAYELIKKHYPKIDIVPVKNTKEGLELLEKGKVFGVIDIMPVLAYLISENEFTDINIKGATPFNFPLQIMIRKDYKILKQLIDKVIINIPEKEKNKILNKYISIKVFEGMPYKQVRKNFILGITVITALLILLIITGIFFFKLKKVKNKLEIIATHDKLITEIYNRFEMDKRLHEEIFRARRYNLPLSLIYIDIDFFKKINDTHGHKKGDVVLKKISKTIQKNIRKTDIFGRWGGEEFLIVLPSTKLSDALNLAEKLRKKISSELIEHIKVTISLGVTELNEKDTFDLFLNRADKALYNAKNKGRNRVCYIK